MKKIISILILLIVTLSITACRQVNALDKIVNKFNNSDTVKSYKDYGFIIKASSNKDVLTISKDMNGTKSTIKFKLEDNILSNENISNEDLMTALLLLDSVGQTYGYKDGELAKNLNAFPDEIKKYTLNKEGLEFISSDEKSSLKIDISKKIPLIDMDNFYLKTNDFDIIKQILADNEHGNQSGKSGNIAYDVFIGDGESTIQIGQENKLSDSAYKSILSALEVIYGKRVANHFQEIYPKFVDGKKTIDAFTIETNYKVEDQEESVFKDTKIVLVTINNDNLK